MYANVYCFPPGPIPLPIIGNVLLFRNKKHFDIIFRQLTNKYGPVFTLWIGPAPFVFVTDIELARNAFYRNDFSGRPDVFIRDLICTDKRSDVFLADYGPKWKALRKVAHLAVQKYSTTDRLIYMASDCVDRTIDTIIANEGFDKPFVPFDYIYYIFLNIMALGAFGTCYSMEDMEYKQIKYVMKEFPQEAGAWWLLWNFSPIFRFIDRKMVNKYKQILNDLIDSMHNRFMNHYNDYSNAIIRDFSDAVISAKNDSLNAGKESATHLTDDNLSMTVFDMFFAGTDSSQQTFRWILLFLTFYPKMQKKLRQEIESVIGDRLPTHEDRNRCHYVMAFISETLRFRNVVPTGVFHKTVVTSKIDKYTIPEGMGVFAYQGIILNNEKNWENADQFNPNRFVENGKYTTNRPKAYIPFGVGRRVCLGEKLAIAHLFIVLVRFLQSTTHYDIVLNSNAGIDPDPNCTDILNPKEFQISFNKIK